MNLLKKSAITAILLIFNAVFLISANDPKPDNKIIRKADNFFIFGDYSNALPIYQKLQELNPENEQFNYRLAVCYFYSSIDILKCIPLFEKAEKSITENDEETIDLYYYLGISYRMVNRFDDAIRCFSKLKSKILPDKEGIKDIKELEMQITNCETGKKLLSLASPISIMNAGKGINSEYPDYSPVISNDESMLLFTSKRKECTGGRTDEDGSYYEDIFISRKEKNNNWQNSVRLDTSALSEKKLLFLKFSKSKKINAINTREHDASVALSPDGKQLYIYRLDDLWVSQLKDEKWEKPSKLNHFINARKSHEPSLSLTMDEQTLYFVSERDGGYGGKDIYKSEKQNDGNWGQPKNLGPVINSEFDEDAPYIDPENKTLYFSSDAYGTMGGFDVFKSRYENDSWTEPENMGCPVNSGADDIFYVFNSRLNIAYFSSIREEGSGNFDIYKIDYNKKKTISTIFAVRENGKLKTSPTFIEIISSQIRDSLKLSNSVNDKGIYDPGKTYSLVINGPDSKQNSLEFNIPAREQSGNYFQEISIDEIKNEKGKITGHKIEINNAFINMDSAIMNTEFAIIPDKIEAYSAYLKSKKNTNGISGLSKTSIESKAPEESFADSKKTISFKSLLFEFNRSDINAGDISELNKIYEYLKDDKNASLLITGYTDSKGDENYNQKLSESRALKAKQYFTRKGIDERRIISTGKGENKPVSNNLNVDGSDNPEGRKLNRRIDFETQKY